MVTEMFADERTEKIKALLLDYKRIDINTLISMIPASPATVRRDLEKMEKEGFLRRTHGGVVLVEAEEPAAPVPVDRYLLEKEQIGAIAVAMIEPNDTVFLGNGTTCLQVAKNLRDRPNIRVVSNNIGVIAELLSAENCRLMVPGGELERAGASACLSGRHALRNISKLYFQKCFISVAAADLNAGYMVDTEDEAELYQILMQHSEQTTLLLDYSKFGQRALGPAVSAP